MNAWWGSFDLAVSLFSGEPAAPPSQDFIMRNAMDSQEVAVGWWPGDHRHPQAAFYAYAHPAPEALRRRARWPVPGAHWDAALGEFILPWDEVVAAGHPHATGARIRPLGVPARLPGLRLGSQAGRHHRGHSPAGHR